MRRIVTLFGTLLPEQDEYPRNWIVLDVDPDLGDAKEFGLFGQIAFLPRQCIEYHEAQMAGERSIVRIPEHIAQLKSELAGNVRQRKGRGRGK